MALCRWADLGLGSGVVGRKERQRESLVMRFSVRWVLG